jgi:hypothetical protein
MTYRLVDPSTILHKEVSYHAKGMNVFTEEGTHYIDTRRCTGIMKIETFNPIPHSFGW